MYSLVLNEKKDFNYSNENNNKRDICQFQSM